MTWDDFLHAFRGRSGQSNVKTRSVQTQLRHETHVGFVFGTGKHWLFRTSLMLPVHFHFWLPRSRTFGFCSLLLSKESQRFLLRLEGLHTDLLKRPLRSADVTSAETVRDRNSELDGHILPLGTLRTLRTGLLASLRTEQVATSNKCIVTTNKCLTSRNKDATRSSWHRYERSNVRYAPHFPESSRCSLLQSWHFVRLDESGGPTVRVRL